MRWLAAIFTVGCHFSPGSVGATDAVGSGADATGDASAAAGYVRLIDLDDAQITGAPHSGFPLLVSLSASWLCDGAHGGDVARADGFDIYFSADRAGATRLAHEVESYAPDEGTLVAWVAIPTLLPTTVLYIHYGDPTITSNPQQVAQVWSAGFELVIHANGDSTGNSTSLVATDVTSATGKIASASAFDGSTSILDVGSATAIDDVFGSGGTAEGWFFANSYGQANYGRLFDKNQESGWGLYVADVSGIANQALAFRHGAAAGSIGSWFTPDGSVSLGAWHHAAVVYDQSSAANTPTLCVDGVAMTVHQVDIPTAPMDSDASADLTIGDRANLDRAFDGVLDELRLSSTPRTSDWLATEYRNQSDPAAFYVVSAPL